MRSKQSTILDYFKKDSLKKKGIKQTTMSQYFQKQTLQKKDIKKELNIKKKKECNNKKKIKMKPQTTLTQILYNKFSEI